MNALQRMIVLCALMLIPALLNAEFIYLKDGQVIQGAIIAEDSAFYTVKTKYQTRKIARDEVIRIMYGERKMERVYLLMNDGTRDGGYLVDQDAEKIILRDTETSPKERTVLKSKVKQMSSSEIIPLEPSLTVRAGMFMPFNSEGAKLKPAPIFYAGSDVNFPWIRDVRIMAEAGYANNESDHDNVYLRSIPILLSASYDFGISRLHIMPVLGVGGTLIDFNDGEGTTTREFAFTADAGLQFNIEIIQRHLFFGLRGDYILIADQKAQLHCAAATALLSYRF